jgi:hypothetical protein
MAAGESSLVSDGTVNSGIGRMIGDLLDLTRTRLGGAIPLKPVQTDLQQLCEEVLLEVQAAHPDAACSRNQPRVASSACVSLEAWRHVSRAPRASRAQRHDSALVNGAAGSQERAPDLLLAARMR